MIHKEICTYEAAKLAKKKGFNEKCYHYYQKGILESDGCFNRYNKGIDSICSAPTQSLLQRWLREEKGIHIAVFPNMANSFEFDYIVYIKGDKFWNPIYTAHNDFATYELALEDALKYALENLI